MLAIAAAAASGFVSFSATLVFSNESQTATFFPNAMWPALISFVTSDAISV